MNDLAQMQMMNQPQQQQQQLMSMSQPPMLSQPPPPMMNQNQRMMNQPQSQGMTQPQMLNRMYGMWPPVDQLKFQNPMQPSGFVSSNQSKLKPSGRGGNWKGKKVNDKRMDGRRKDKPPVVAAGSSGGIGGGGGGYKPPSLNELQYQNRLKARKFYPKKKFNNINNSNNRSAPYAPRNTTSFIIRAKKSGGIASLVSPCPVTPAVLPTPIFSPSREVLVDMAKEEWGVDGYGSMKGLIRLRSPGNEMEAHEEDEEDEGGSSDSDVEEHVEVERRLDHDLSRFEMIYPNYTTDYNNVLENRVDDQDTHIAQLEEENLILKERLFLMERELGDLRRRMLSIEKQNHGEVNEGVVENESEEGCDSHDGPPVVEENNEEVVEENNEGGRDFEEKEEKSDDNVDVQKANYENVVPSEIEVVGDVCVEENAHTEDEMVVEKDEMIIDDRAIKEGDDKSKDEGAGNGYSDESIDHDDQSNCPSSMFELVELLLDETRQLFPELVSEESIY